MQPVHRRVRGRGLGGRRQGRLSRSELFDLITVLGLGAALAGAALALLAGPDSVYATAGRLHVGATTLRLVASTAITTTYAGDAAYVLTQPGDGSASAGSSWTSGGLTSSARCSMHSLQTLIVESCTFTLGTTRLTAIDTFDLTGDGTWQRTYANGHRVVIAVPRDGGVVPLAFPIGL